MRKRATSLTTQQIARLFKARRISKGKWRASCPVHGGRYSQPLSIAEGHSGTLVKCFGGCDTNVVLAAVGLTLRDLFADSGFNPTPEMRQKWADEEWLKLKERQHGLAIMAQAVLPGERRYWEVVERNCALEIRRLTDILDPSEKKERERNEETQRILAEYGEELWECVP